MSLRGARRFAGLRPERENHYSACLPGEGGKNLRQGFGTLDESEGSLGFEMFERHFGPARGRARFRQVRLSARAAFGALMRRRLKERRGGHAMVIMFPAARGRAL